VPYLGSASGFCQCRKGVSRLPFGLSPTATFGEERSVCR